MVSFIAPTSRPYLAVGVRVILKSGGAGPMTILGFDAHTGEIRTTGPSGGEARYLPSLLRLA